MSTIYLVRHGQASFGSDNYDQLSKTGREQVRLLGNFLAEAGDRFDHIYTGGLQRQRETADLIAAALGTSAPPITVDPAFEEYDSDIMLKQFAASQTSQELDAAGWPGERHNRRKFQLFLERAALAWVEARIEAPGMLPWKSFHGRIVDGLNRIMLKEGRSRTLIISTSGGVIGTAVAHVLGLSNHMSIELNWAVHNASITRLIYSADKVSLSMFNALPHLERDERRQLITYR